MDHWSVQILKIISSVWGCKKQNILTSSGETSEPELDPWEQCDITSCPGPAPRSWPRSNKLLSRSSGTRAEPETRQLRPTPSPDRARTRNAQEGCGSFWRTGPAPVRVPPPFGTSWGWKHWRPAGGSAGWRPAPDAPGRWRAAGWRPAGPNLQNHQNHKKTGPV